MKPRRAVSLVILSMLLAAVSVGRSATQAKEANLPPGEQRPCDIYAAAQAPCVAAHSTTRALYASYEGPLYQVLRQSDGRTLNIGVVRASAGDAGGYANSAAQDAFCANTNCWISIIYDQSPQRNHLHQAPRGGFYGHGLGGFNNLPLADAAPTTVMGHKVYGVFIVPGMGLRLNDPRGTAVDDQAQGQYWVINGHHYNSGCCFNYGNVELTSRDDGNGTMESTNFSNSTGWFHGSPPGPWIMTDQENNLVGCVNPGSPSKLCVDLPSISWRFVTAMAKGRPGRWASLGGDAQSGALRVMFEGPRVDVTYDPMRKQGAILLGNGGDNSVVSQGTFYEGAMTAANTYPSNETDQLVQANVVAARYDVAMLSVAPANAIATPPGLQTFVPGSTQETAIRFTNTSGAPVADLRFSLGVPAGWTASAERASVAGPVAAGASVEVTFRVTSGPAGFDGDMVANASWTGSSGARNWRAVQKLRNAPPVKINEFRIGDAVNTTNGFIELFNDSDAVVDISNWNLIHHQVWQAIASSIRIPAGTRLAPRGFYLLGLSNSGLAAPVGAGDSTIHVRSIDGLKVGDSIEIGGETRRITRIGTAASPETTIWQPMPEGRSVMTVPKGATNVPVAATDGFVVGEKIALGYGSDFPSTYRTTERYEIATATSVGQPGVYPYLAAEAAAGATNISVTSVATIRAGDRIRLDIASVGHGIETVTVKNVGTAANLMVLAAEAQAGTTRIRVRPGNLVFNNVAVNSGAGLAGLAVNRTLIVGKPGNRETVTITAVNGDSVDIKPALSRNHSNAEHAIDPGTGLDLLAPLQFNHSANLPFSNRGTGIDFTPATRFARSTNEPVQPLGTGITLDRPLAQGYAIDAVVRVAGVTTAGYQGSAPQQWFGGPALAAAGGSMVLRDAAGRAVDSLNYGLIVQPSAAEGYQGISGTGQVGCRAPAAGGRGGRGAVITLDSSAGRMPDGHDTDSNCNDFMVQPGANLAAGATAGSDTIKVTGVADFAPGQTLTIDQGVNMETATIAAVGTAGATTSREATAAGDAIIPVGVVLGFTLGQSITIGDGPQSEVATVEAIYGGGAGPRITVTAPLRFAHPRATAVAGSGVRLGTVLTRTHAAGVQVTTDFPTPGAANRYSLRR
jgi:non-reducing end alpha-L-arabinofuranosidase